jgi:adenine phosphoribosyltransferase
MPHILKNFIRDVPNFPAEGIIFKDITPLLQDAEGLSRTISLMAEPWRKTKVDVVCAIEARGFIFGCALACELGAGFVPIRKPGKLPYKTASKTYSLEYGTDTIEIHTDAVRRGTKVLMVDDLLATGGTMAAACGLVEELGGEILGVSFVIELEFLKGREKLTDYDVRSLVVYH